VVVVVCALSLMLSVRLTSTVSKAGTRGSRSTEVPEDILQYEYCRLLSASTAEYDAFVGVSGHREGYKRSLPPRRKEARDNANGYCPKGTRG
jgi:hypothetical protein